MQVAHFTRRIVAPSLLALSLAAPAVGAQSQPYYPRPATAFAALSGNALVGGATAALRARLGRRDALRAFARGSLGGAVHFAGKYVGTRPGSLSGPVGVVIGSTGTAMVSNAGRDAALLDELFLPVGPLRVRLARADSGDPRRVRLSLNVYDGLRLAHTFTRSGLRVDWERSASAGAFVFVARGREIEMDGERYAGLAVGSTAIVSGLSTDMGATTRHEATHVQQHWFYQEAWTRPVEQALRRRVRVLRWLPSWLEPGVAMLPLWMIEEELGNGPYGPLSRLGESEAGLLERQ